ncbi:MAG: hypothetical protein OXC07_02115 [Kistimonas sp.]|nr:hypothetical protein [Kistimonas sp.]
MNGIQTGTAIPEHHGSLDACVMRPVSPTSQYGGRGVDPLADPVTTSRPMADSIVPSSPHERTAPQDTGENQDPKRFCSLPDLGNPHLKINYPASDWTPPQLRVQLPPSSPILEKDEALTGSLHKPESLSAINKLLAERCDVEKHNGEFKLHLLMPSLRNMRTFISHIRDGHQFTEPLTDGEHKTLAWLAEKTQELLNAEAPYKRTVHLSIALVLLYEIITERQIFDPRRRSDSQESGTDFWKNQIDPSFSCPAEPTIITQCCWGGNNPAGLDEKEHFIKKYEIVAKLDDLFSALDDNTLFVLPSFQELGLNDFCRFGHLRVYPIGIMTTYALNADGEIMGPLQFAAHDIVHMSAWTKTRTYAQLPEPLSPGQLILSSSQHRLALRCLLQDQLPANLASLKLDSALILLLFDFLHEQSPVEAAPALDYSHAGFATCFSILAVARRQARGSHVKEFQSVTDTEAARAALWTLSLWKCWQTADFGALPQQQLETCARDFKQRELPRLEKHLEFIEWHRGALRQMFADRHCKRIAPGTTSDHFIIRSRDFNDEADYLSLFWIRHQFSGLCHLDNTDVIYFHALSSPVLRGQMESVTGASLPDEILDMTDCPPPMQAALLLEEPDTRVA